MSLRNTIGSSDLETTDFAFPQDAVAGLCADAEYFAHLLNTLHLPDKKLLQNKLRELTELALESGEGDEV